MLFLPFQKINGLWSVAEEISLDILMLMDVVQV